VVKLKDIYENKIGAFTWSGYYEKGRSLDNTVGGQPAGKSLKRRVAEKDDVNEFVGIMTVGFLIRQLAKWAKNNPEHISKLKAFVKKL
jgi:hypothetical protein